MQLELTIEQADALVGNAHGPVEFIDPRTQSTYVLVEQKTLSHLQGSMDEGDARSLEEFLAELDPQDWEDLSAYEGKYERLSG